MRGILIDPLERSVGYLESESFELEELHDLIGAECLDFAHPFGWRETVVVDDVGMAKKLPSFELEGYGWPIYGRAIILGRGTAGGTRSTELSVEGVHEMISFG